MSEKQKDNGCLVMVVIFFAISFIGIAGETLLGFLFGGKSFLSQFLDRDSEGTNLMTLRIAFWALVIVLVMFFVRGGKLEDIFRRKD